MKLIKLIFVVLVLIFIGGFAYFAVTDVPVEQRLVTKDIDIPRSQDTP